MGLTEDAKVLAIIAAAPELGTPDDTDAFLNAVAVAELASMWGVLQRLGLCDLTSGAWAAKLYFDHLPHRMPDRALDLMLEVLRSEADKATVMALNNKLLPALLYVHGQTVLALLAAGPLEGVISVATIDRIEREAAANKRFHDLLGVVWYYRASDALKARLDALVGENRW